MSEPTIDLHAEDAPATLTFNDGTGDGWFTATPGWLLDYQVLPEPGEYGDLDTVGRAYVHKTAYFDDIPGDEPERAVRTALTYLGRAGVRAGRQLTTAQAAELAGVEPSSWRADVAKNRVPWPGGRYDARTPWWWESTVLAVRASRRPRTYHSDTLGPVTIPED